MIENNLEPIYKSVYKTDLFICECESEEHQIIFRYDSEDNELYLSVHLNNSRSLFKKIILAIKYVFGYKSKYGNFNTVIIRPSDKERLINVINQLKTHQ